MSRPPRGRRLPGTGSAGVTLIEVMVALVVLSIGILAFARMFPRAMVAQRKSRMVTTASQYANETFERLQGVAKTNALLSSGRHPVTGSETLGPTGAWSRYYTVAQMPAPLDSLLKVTVTVSWRGAQPESIVTSGYIFP